jgi:transcriptional regulator with XRE-family HTH domain
MTQQEIGNAIKERRKKLGINQQTLADLASVAVICCLKVPIVSDEGRRGAHRTLKNRHRLEAMPILFNIWTKRISQQQV